MKPLYKDFGVDVYFDESKYTVYDNSQADPYVAKGFGEKYVVSEKGYGKVFETNNIKEAIDKAKELQAGSAL